MDIFDIAPQSRTIEILHPATSEPTGLKVSLLPMSDDKIESVRRKQLNRRLNSRNTKVTAEQLEAESMELLIASITGWEWSGTASFQGEKPEFTPDNVRRVMKAAKWVRDQIDREAGYAEAFFEA